MPEHVAIDEKNELVPEDPIPPIEYAPPYSLDFVAHLHGGCYPDDQTPLLRAVRTDADGARMLDALVLVQLELGLQL